MSQESKGFFKKYNNFFKANEENKNEEATNLVEALTENATVETSQNVSPTIDEDESYKPINRHASKSEDAWHNGTVTDCVRLNIRKEPNLNADILTVIDAGTNLLFQDLPDNGEWNKVKVEGKVGYTMAQYIVELQPNYM